ncbi:hypothetical protein CVT24_008069 [Panaeolus cyanescens]|uniref:Uncharacterized protein n=1 Tax=Panaeolus cyanescens TaxID=181874 RepID=A0A409YQN0_9AGAR|nr:hypothetical protein CVT24_008069 [Panaeolus cyanescens]
MLCTKLSLHLWTLLTLCANYVLCAPTTTVTFRPDYKDIALQGNQKAIIDNAFAEDTLGSVMAGKARLSKLFHAKTGPEEYLRALTLIHEGTHLRPGGKKTDDNFDWTNGEGSDLKTNHNKGSVCGCLPKNPKWPANYETKFTPPSHVKSTIVNSHHPDSVFYFETTGNSHPDSSRTHPVHHASGPESVMQYLDSSSPTPHHPHQHGSHAGVSISQIGSIQPHPYLTQPFSQLNLNHDHGYEEAYDNSAAGAYYEEYYSPHPYPDSHQPVEATKKPKKKGKKQEPSMMLELFSSGSSKKKGKK